MKIMENLKTIFETITVFRAAVIIIIGCFKLMPKNCKEVFFFQNIPLFLKVTIGDTVQ